MNDFKRSSESILFQENLEKQKKILKDKAYNAKVKKDPAAPEISKASDILGEFLSKLKISMNTNYRAPPMQPSPPRQPPPPPPPPTQPPTQPPEEKKKKERKPPAPSKPWSPSMIMN